MKCLKDKNKHIKEVMKKQEQANCELSEKVNQKNIEMNSFDDKVLMM
tara:strand:+ start:362 stop:502 length:141 start_codon:yes stop_codon:yes gene_type:complete